MKNRWHILPLLLPLASIISAPAAAGVQNFRYLAPADVRPGRIVMAGTVLFEAPDNAWICFKPECEWGWYTYRITRTAAEPASRPPESTLSPPVTPPLTDNLSWQRLRAGSQNARVSLDGEIVAVMPDGCGMDGDFWFAGEKLRLHFMLDEQQARGPSPNPTWRNLAYGPDCQQTLDLYRAPVAGPGAVAVFIHGGAWLGGDKSEVNQYEGLLRAGISVVAINYRYCPPQNPDPATPAVAWPLRDAARAVQFVRYRAAAWGCDKERLGLWGESAGACSALWVALHPEMADPQSSDPVARESTRPRCVVAIVPQTSLDPAQMRAWVGPALDYGAHAFGIAAPRGRSPASFAKFLADRPRLLPWIREYSPAAWLGAGNPPVYLDYGNIGLTPFEPADSFYPHSPRFGLASPRWPKN